jgi:predicted TIM-barrel fold metal-dependent hydrolase
MKGSLIPASFLHSSPTSGVSSLEDCSADIPNGVRQKIHKLCNINLNAAQVKECLKSLNHLGWPHALRLKPPAVLVA